MRRATGIGYLRPFLPGLEAALGDPEVSELMINGPRNVWIERRGELEPLDAPALGAAALHRAAIHIARPLGLDPAASPHPRRSTRGRLEGRHLHPAGEPPRGADDPAVRVEGVLRGRSRPHGLRPGEGASARPGRCSAHGGTSSCPAARARARPRSWAP